MYSCVEERERKILENEGLVYYIANMYTKGIPDEDIVSIGRIGLIKAVDTYDEKKKIKFASYAYTCIKNEIFMYFRRENRNIKTISLNEAICRDASGGELLYEEILPSLEKDILDEIIETESFIRIFNYILNCLRTKEKIAILYKASGMSQMTIASKMDCTQSYISRIIKKGSVRLKEYLEEPKTYLKNIMFSVLDENYIININFGNKYKRTININNIMCKIGILENEMDLKITKDGLSIVLPGNAYSFEIIARIVKELEIEVEDK